MPLLLRLASHSSFACGLRARLEEARNRSANQPPADCPPHPVRIHSKRLQTASRSCDEAELRSEGAPGEFPPDAATVAQYQCLFRHKRRKRPQNCATRVERATRHKARTHQEQNPALAGAGCRGGVSPHKKSVPPAKYQKQPPADCPLKKTAAKP